MIRKIYSHFILRKLADKEYGWIAKRGWQYFLIYLSYFFRKPLCGPVLGTLFTNYRCNYHCKMCDLPLREGELKNKGYRELTTQEFKKVIGDFHALGVAGIGFTGGEPLLRQDICELLSYTKALGMVCHLNTNGYFLNEETAKKIIEAGVDSLNISLDGDNPKTHDAIRGHQGAFERAVSGMKIVEALRLGDGAKIRLKLVSVIDENNIDEVEGLIELSQKLKADSIEFMPKQPFYKGAKISEDNYTEVFFRKLDEAIKTISAYQRKGINIENSFRGLALFKKSFAKEKSPLRCYAAYNSYTVDCFGEIYPCLSFLNWDGRIGNIRETHLREFWYCDKYNKMRKEFSKCGKCYLNCHTELNLLFNIFPN